MPSNLLTELYNAYKDWCISNRLSPISARRFYNSVWETFRAEMHRTNGRGLFRGIRLILEPVPTGADAAGAADARQV